MRNSKQRAMSLQEAEARIVGAESKVADLRLQLSDAIREVRDAKRGANELLLGGIVDPLVDVLIANGEFDVLEICNRLCTTTQKAVAPRIHKLVYRFEPAEQDATCHVGVAVQRICHRFPYLNHLQVMDGPKHVSLESMPNSIHIFDIKRNNLSEGHLESLTVNPSLQVIRLRRCEGMETIRNLHLCSSLRELDLSGSWNIHPDVLTALDSCNGLQKLVLAYPPSLRAFDCGACYRMDSNAYLAVDFQGERLNDISWLSRCPALKELWFNRCTALPSEAFKVLGSCTGLQRLRIYYCFGIEEVPDLKACTHLQAIFLSALNLSNTSHLSSCPALKELTLEFCYGLPRKAFKALESCTGLQKLQILDSLYLREFPNLHACTQLGSVGIQGCVNVINISHLSSCPALKELNFDRCTALPSGAFGVLELCTGLQKLHISCCQGLEEIPNLQACTQLETLGVQNCCNLSTISKLSSCLALKELKLDLCSALPSKAFKVLGSCTGLQNLHISDCQGLQEIPNLKACTSLEAIYISSCENLRTIARLSTCPSLRHLSIVRCESLTKKALKALAAYKGLQRNLY